MTQTVEEIVDSAYTQGNVRRIIPNPTIEPDIGQDCVSVDYFRTTLTRELERAKSEERESTTDFIKTIHTELHNGRMEDAYRVLCKFLNALAE